MIVECAKACRTCHLRDPKVRCQRNESEPQMLLPHAMGALFRAVDEGSLGAEWGPVTVLSRSPWIATFDNFLTSAEADALVALIPPASYARSSNVGGMDELGRFKQSLDSSRTSLNAWCEKECAQSAIMQEITRRVETLTGIPEANAEYMCARQARVRCPSCKSVPSFFLLPFPCLMAMADGCLRAGRLGAARHAGKCCATQRGNITKHITITFHNTTTSHLAHASSLSSCTSLTSSKVARRASPGSILLCFPKRDVPCSGRPSLTTSH